MKTLEIIRGLLSETSFYDLKNYVQHSCRHSGTYDSDFHRVYTHESPVLYNLHAELAPYASALFDLPLKPSYSFISNYLDGGKCPLHVDRPQCLRTIDLLVSSDNPEPWLLRIADPWTDEQFEEYDGPRGLGVVESGKEPDLDVIWHDVLLDPNDAVCYSGTHSWHYRPEPSNGRVDLIFFHFVHEDFDGPLE